MDDRPVALRIGGMMKQEDGDRFGQKWSDLDKSIRTDRDILKKGENFAPMGRQSSEQSRFTRPQRPEAARSG